MRFIIPVIIGAIIGYITNWLAIKMLFRPYEKKYILGLPLPFTPGLIPKEQQRIAKSIGDTVGEYLLSEDIIMEKLVEAELAEKLKIFLEASYEELTEGNPCLRDLLDWLDLDKDSLDGLVSKFSTLFYQEIRKGHNKKKIEEFIEKLVKNLEYEDRILDLTRDLGAKLGDIQLVEDILEGFLDGIFSELEQDDRRLGDLLEADMIKNQVLENSHILVGFIRDSIDDFMIADRVKELLNELIEENLSRPVRMFVSPDNLSEKIYRILESYIYREDFDEKLKPVLASLVDKLMDYRPREVMERLDPEDIRRNKDQFISLMARELVKIRGTLFNGLAGYLLDREEKIKLRISDSLIQAYEGFLDREELKPRLEDLVKRGVNLVLDQDLTGPMKRFGEGLGIVVGHRLVDYLILTMEVRLPDLIAEFNVSEIVEEEINKFEVDFAEKIILDIASKELEAITWLGALLGGLMGAFSPLLQMI